MIVKDEEKNLIRSLNSVKNYVDELLITDTGSKDKTVEIAEQFGCTVSHFNWKNDFSAARNFSIEKAKSEYILFLDADEEISPENWQKIIDSLKINKGKAFRLTLKSKMQNGFNYGKSVRLFPNISGLKFIGKAHEQIDQSLIEMGVDIVNCNAVIEHHGYNVSENEIQQKASRNLSLLLNEHQLNPSSFTEFHIGTSFLILKKYEEAINYLSASIQKDDLYVDYKISALKSIALIYYRFGKNNEALNSIAKALSISQNSPDLINLAAKIHVKLGNINEAILLCKFGLEQHETKTDFIIKDDFEIDELVYFAANLSLTNNRKDDFNLFVKYLSDQKTKELVIKLFNKALVSNYDIDYCFEILNRLNEALIISLIFRLDEEIQQYFVENLSVEQIQSEEEIIRISNHIQKENMNIDYTNLLEKYSEVNDSPAIITYLISVYLKEQKLNKIEELLSKLNSQVEKYPELANYLELLNSKMLSVVK